MRLQISGIGIRTPEHKIRELLEQYGEVESMEMHTTGSLAYATAEMDDVNAQAAKIGLSNFDLGGMWLSTKLLEPVAEGQSQPIRVFGLRHCPWSYGNRQIEAGEVFTLGNGRNDSKLIGLNYCKVLKPTDTISSCITCHKEFVTQFFGVHKCKILEVI